MARGIKARSFVSFSCLAPISHRRDNGWCIQRGCVVFLNKYSASDFFSFTWKWDKGKTEIVGTHLYAIPHVMHSIMMGVVHVLGHDAHPVHQSLGRRLLGRGRRGSAHAARDTRPLIVRPLPARGPHQRRLGDEREHQSFCNCKGIWVKILKKIIFIHAYISI